MSQDTVENKQKSFKEIEDVISRAIKKVGVRKENDLCRFIPATTGGYLHHFTMKKMKTKQPKELLGMIEKFIINVDHPGRVAPKQRAPRGSRKRKDQVTFTRSQIERMLNLARATGDKEMVTLLSPRRSLATCKRELIASVRANRIESELWTAYLEAAQAQQAAISMMLGESYNSKK
jgi:hypothetical protein